MRQFKLRFDCVVALSMTACTVVGSVVQQVWPPLSYENKYMKVSTSVGGSSFAHPWSNL